jgi:hypothetical protein
LTVLSDFADVSLWQLVLVAGVALFAAIIGGLAGNGTGALMPLALVSLISRCPARSWQKPLSNACRCISMPRSSMPP